MIKTKNRNHSANKIKNLEYDRRLPYKKPRQGSGFCRFSFARYSQKCVTQIYKPLYIYGEAMFVQKNKQKKRWSREDTKF